VISNTPKSFFAIWCESLFQLSENVSGTLYGFRITHTEISDQICSKSRWRPLSVHNVSVWRDIETKFLVSLKFRQIMNAATLSQTRLLRD